MSTVELNDHLQSIADNSINALLRGRTIVNVRLMSVAEAAESVPSSPFRRPYVLELDDGTILFPTSDADSCAVGTMHVLFPDGSKVSLPVIEL